MLERVLRHLRNWFLAGGIHCGTFAIEEGTFNAPFLIAGQYFRINGSVLNDGVYQYPAEGLTDETFAGEIWPLAIPKALLELVGEIEQWQTTNGKAADGPYTSESFGGYTYTKATDAKTGGSITWESAFRSRLSIWRKL